MPAVGYAVLPITPSLKGLSKQLDSELLKPAQAAAKRAAGDINKQLADGAKKAAAEVDAARRKEQAATEAVLDSEKKLSREREAAKRAAGAVESAELKLKSTREKASRDVAAAEKAVTDARKTGDVQALADAESRLSEVRSKSDASIIDRENQLSRARDAVSASSDKIVSAERDVASAKDKAAEASENVIAATRRQDDAQRVATTNTSKYAGALDKVKTKAASTGRAIADAADKYKVHAAAVVGAVGLVAREAVTYASEAEQSYGAVESIFGDHAAGIIASSKAAATAVGVSGHEYRELSAVTGAMLKNMGMPMDEVATKSQDLVSVGADLAATFGGSTKDAMEAINALMRGEADPIERYGVSIKKTDVNARLAAQGLDKLEGEALKQAEAQALLTMLTEQTASAQGQFSRETDTAAHKQQVATARLADAKETIGTALLPVYAQLADMVGKVASVVGSQPGVFLALGGAIVTAAGAILGINAAVTAYSGITAAATAITKALNISMKTLWISTGIGAAILAVAAALTWFFTKTETGQRVWQSFMDVLREVGAWLKGVLVAAWDSVSQAMAPVVEWLGQISDAAVGVWNILTKGDFTGGIFGLEEDSAVVDWLFSARDAISGIWDKMAAAPSAVWDALVRAWETLSPILSTVAGIVTDSLGGALGSLWETLQTLSGTVMEVGRAVGGALLDALQGWWSTVTGLWSGLRKLWDVLSPLLLPVLKVVAAVVGGALLGSIMAAAKVLQGLAWGVSQVAKVFSWLVETALVPVIGFAGRLADVVGTVLGGAFRLVGGAVAVARDMLVAAWQVIKPVLDGLWTVLKVIGAVLITAVVVPFQIGWNLISAAVQYAWTTHIQPVWEGMKTGLGLLGTAFSWVWTSVIKPVWDALGAGIRWVADTIVRPVWDGMKVALGALGSFFSWVWNSVIKPAWDALGAGIRWVVDTIVRPAWDGMKIGLDLLGQAFSWAWNNVIKPVWDGLGAGIAWVVDTVVRPVFDRIMEGLDLVKGAFRMAVDVIGSVWNEMREKTAAPIRFVIDTVYNKGIVAVWNKVAGWLGMDDKTLDVMPLTFASGGVLPGYTPGRDVHKFVNPATGQGLHLSGGEAIMRPEWTRAVGGPAAVDRMNRAARSGKLPLDEREALRQTHRHAMGGVLAFANGGVVGEGPIVNAMIRIVQQKYPQMHMTSGRIGRADANHGRGMAADFAWPGAFGPHPAQLSLANDIADTYPGSMELIYGPGFARQIKNGAIVGDGGGSYGFYAGAGDHSNHVHWAMNVPPTIPFGGGVFEGGSDGSGAGGGFASAIGGLVRSAMNKIMDPIMSAIPEGPGLVGGLGKGFGTKLWDEFKNWVLSKVPSGGGGQYGNIDLSGVAGDNLAIGQAAADQVGWTGPEWDALKELWTRESTWNHLAQNPTSTAFGIAQFLDSTWAPYGPKTDDPRKQIEYGVRYIQDRYGTPSAALAFHDANNWYDQGGWLPDGGLGINQSGKPEPVFTNAQWTLIKSLIISTAEVLDPLRVLARNGRDALDHLAQIASDTRRGVRERIDAELGAAGAAVWAALPGEVREALTVAQAVGAQWERVSGYLSEKAVAWSKGEWPIGSARTPVVEPGPGWQQFRLDDSLEQVARANVELAEQVITGKVSPGSDPVANAIYDVFGRDPILPDLARIAAGGTNAITAATDAALHAFETGETARLEEWTASNSQLTEAVLRARDAAIVTGEMVQGAVNGYLNWAMASDSQGRQGSWQEYFQHYGGEYGTAQGDWLLSQVGLGGILGGKLKDSAANLLIEAAKSPLLAAPAILDDDGRVIGTQLETQQAAAMGTTAAAPGMDPALTADPAALTPAPINPDGAAAKTIEVSVTLPEGKSAFTAEEVTQMLTKIDEDVDEIKIEVNQMKNEPASVTSGVSLMV